MVSTSRRRGVTADSARKVPCRVATTANITLSGEQTIDTVSVVTDDRVLVKDQTTASENGIYIADTSSWTRAPDWDGELDVVQGTLVFITAGTNLGHWRVTTSNPITPGTTSVALIAADTDATLREDLNAGLNTNIVLLSKHLNEAKGSDIASATTADIGAATGNYVDITGTTTITGLGTIQAGSRRTVQFDGALTLTYNATSLILPGDADIITAAGDTAEFISLGSGNWICTKYTRDTVPYLGGKGDDIASATTTSIGLATGEFVDITGTTTITGFGTTPAGVKRVLQFDGVLILTYNATSLILPGNANITTAAGDVATFISLGSGNWICTSYQRDLGQPPLSGTFSPTLQDTTGSDAEGQTYSANTGEYHVIGEMVFFTLRILVSSLGTLTTGSAAFIANLPFSSHINTQRGGVTIGLAGGLNISANQVVTGYVTPTLDYITLNLWDATTGTSALLISEVSASGDLAIGGFYRMT